MASISPLRLTLFGIACFFAAFFMATRLYNDGKPGWTQIVTSDGRGYYAYLPALFIDRDLSFSTTTQREAALLGYQQYKPAYIVKKDDHVVNKYFAGEALLLLPFFLLAWLLSVISGLPADGYSFFFQFFTGIGALFYLVWGLLFLEKIMHKLGIRNWASVLAVVAIVAGTNLFYYALWQPTMSHIYSFFAILGFLWHAMKVYDKPQRGQALVAGFFFGITCLIRPTNGIVVLMLPFLISGEGSIRRIPVLPILLSFTAVIALQPILWYMQTGNLFIWPYQGEGFHFFSPEIINTLFSYRKGLFIYSPVLLLIIPGLFATALRSLGRFSAVVLFLIAAVWIIASWWNWYYGDGFGLRAFIDYYGIFAILIAIGIEKMRGFTRHLIWMVVLVFIGVNLIQTWQYTHRVIHPNSMNAAKFHHIFLRCDSAVIGSIGGNHEMADYTIDLSRPALELFNDYSLDQKHWSPIPAVATPVAYSGGFCTFMDSLNKFGKGIEVNTGTFFSMPSRIFLEGTLMIRDSVAGASNTVLIVLSMDSIAKGENYWQGFRVNDLPDPPARTWRPVTFSLMLPEISNPGGILKVYTWQTGKGTVWVDDFRIKLYSGKQ